jgi:hypothetical protein
VTAFLTLDDGPGMVVAFAGDGVALRVRWPGSGGWTPLRVEDGIGTVAIDGHGFGTDAIEVETTYAGDTTVGRVDTFLDLPTAEAAGLT